MDTVKNGRRKGRRTRSGKQNGGKQNEREEKKEKLGIIKVSEDEEWY